MRVFVCVRSWWLLSTLPLNRLMKSGCNVYSSNSSRNNVKSLLALSLPLSRCLSFSRLSLPFALSVSISPLFAAMLIFNYEI